MAILTNKQKIGNYEVIRLIKENHYCETYRVEDEKEEPFFLKLFILKNTPEKMLDENHKVISVGVLAKLRHKNIISYVEHGVYQDDTYLSHNAGVPQATASGHKGPAKTFNAL